MGPDFRAGFTDAAPTSNADIGRTMAAILGLQIHDRGKLIGRVLSEAMPNGKMPDWNTSWQVSAADSDGRRTIVQTQHVGDARYLSAAGYKGRTVGLSPPEGKQQIGE